MWETRWAILTVTGYYAYQTRKRVKVEADRSEFEAKRSELESRPYLEVRFLDWGAGNLGPQFDLINVRRGSSSAHQAL